MYQDPNPKFAKQISKPFVRTKQTANGVPQMVWGTPKLLGTPKTQLLQSSCERHQNLIPPAGMYQDPNPEFAKRSVQRFVRTKRKANGVPQNHLGYPKTHMGTPKLNFCNRDAITVKT